jgi:anti-sigma B factor antagonist
MPSSLLQVKSSAQGTTRVVAVTGELDVASVKRVENAIDVALSEQPETVVLDLGALSFCDSSGIRLALAAERRATAQGVRFVVVRPVGTARRVFDICRLDGRLTLVAPQDAMTADGSPASVASIGGAPA